MAHGLPDYYRGIDIAFQALSDLIVRPRYGAAKSKSSATAIVALETTTLLTISGKGMLYGGYSWLDYTSSQKNASVILTLDNSIMFSDTLGTMNQYKMNKARSLAVALLSFDEVNFRYCVGFSYGYTFEESIVLKYDETQGGTPTVISLVLYALVT